MLLEEIIYLLITSSGIICNSRVSIIQIVGSVSIIQQTKKSSEELGYSSCRSTVAILVDE